MHGGAYRYIYQASRGGDMLGTIDSYVGIGYYDILAGSERG